MKSTVVPIVLLILSYAILFGYIAASYGEMPDKVASHFDLNGQPNGWMSRETCVAFTVAMGLIVPAAIIGAMAFAGKIPVSFINLPHKEYWLTPERRQEALGTLLRYSLWLAILTVLLLASAHWLIVQANQPGYNGHLETSHLLGVMGVFVAATVTWIALLVRRFKRIV